MIIGSLTSGCKKEEGLVPVITTREIRIITQTSAICGGIVSSAGSADVLKKGVCWSKETEPTIENYLLVDEISLDTFICVMTGLNPGTKYFVRSYGINRYGTGYGVEVSFETNPATIPVISTKDISLISQTSAVCGGVINSDGASDIISRGVCWNTIKNPTVNDHVTNDGSGIRTFSSVISGLTGNTTYFIRAYSTNSVGTSYGNQIIFKTSPLTPTVTTLTISSISAVTAVSGGNIASDGGDSVAFRGVCWSTLPDPTVIDYRTVNSFGIGNYESKIDNLLPSTTYYVRAYAANISGISYGEQILFTTRDGIPQSSIIKTIAVASTCVTLAINISNDGGAEVLQKGVCISLNHNPTTIDKTSNNTEKAATFAGHFEDLSINTHYYARPYIKNAFGTFYGPESEFETLETISDIEGNIYNIVSIGTQVWMAQNLEVKQFNDGTIISNDFETLSNIPWYWKEPLVSDYGHIWGLLYNGVAVGSGKLCPVGWHIPKKNEWYKLFDTFGGTSLAGGKQRSPVYKFWNTGGNNESCFSGIGAGYIYWRNRTFNDIRLTGKYWANESQGTIGWYFSLYSGSSGIGIGPDITDMHTAYWSWEPPAPWLPMHEGMSVRCVKD